jgi:hypothetical protein
MTTWLSNLQNTPLAFGHRQGAISAEPEAPELTEAERTRRRCARIRSVPCVYLKCPPERKQNEQFAMAALLGLEHHTHRREEVLGMVNLHCPNLFQNPAAMQELFLNGNTAGIEHIVMRMYTRISWDRDLALLGLGRSAEIYRYLPSSLQVSDDVVEKLVADPLGPNHLGRFAPRTFLLEHPDLILQVINKGFRTIDIPLELRRSKEFIIKAVETTPGILTECPLEMISEKDVLLAVAGQDHTDAMVFLENALKRSPGNPKKVLVPFAQEVKAKLDNHAAFYTLLQGISVSGHPGSASPLNLLHCGEETSVALKREIADFLGAPTQTSEYNILKKAWDTSVADYYNANVTTMNPDAEEAAREAQRKLQHRSRRVNRQMLTFVRRDTSNGRAEMNGRRDYRRILHHVQMVVGEANNNEIVRREMIIFDSDSELDSDLETFGNDF